MIEWALTFDQSWARWMRSCLNCSGGEPCFALYSLWRAKKALSTAVNLSGKKTELSFWYSIRIQLRLLTRHWNEPKPGRWLPYLKPISRSFSQFFFLTIGCVRFVWKKTEFDTFTTTFSSFYMLFGKLVADVVRKQGNRT